MASIVHSTDFVDNALAGNGVTVSRTPVTQSLTGNGDEILTKGTPEDVFAIFHKRKPLFIQNEQGVDINTSAYIMIPPSQALNRNDLITYQSHIYRVINTPITRGPSGDVEIYTYADLEFVDNGS